MYRVCFVCLGNICRSPMAAAVFRARVRSAGLADRVEVSSAGTGAYHVGQPADVRTARVLQRAGYASDHVARHFTAQSFADADLVVAVDAANEADLRRIRPAGHDVEIRLLRSFDPAAGDLLDVPDPYHGEDAAFTATLAMVEAACDGLLDHVRGQVGA